MKKYLKRTLSFLLSAAMLISMVPAVYAAEGAADFVIEPYVLAPAADGMTIAWEADQGGTASIALDGGAAIEVAADADAPEFQGEQMHFYSYRFEDLKPDTAYDYTVTLDGGKTFKASFETLPKNPDEARVIFITDTHSFAAGKELEAFIKDYDPDFIIHTGDILEGTGEYKNQFANWLVNRDFIHSIPVVYAPGNHDFGDYYTEYFGKAQAEAYKAEDETGANYSFDYAGIHFIMIDSNPWGLMQMNVENAGGEISGALKASIEATKDWIEDDLDDADDADFIIMGAHHPFDDDFTQKHIPELIEEYGVDLYLAGHDHTWAMDLSADPTVGAGTVYICGETGSGANWAAISVEDGILAYDTYTKGEKNSAQSFVLATEKQQLSYSDVSISPAAIRSNESVTVKAKITNTGDGLAAAVLPVKDNGKTRYIYNLAVEAGGSGAIQQLKPGASMTLYGTLKLSDVGAHKLQIGSYSTTVDVAFRAAEYTYSNLRIKLGDGEKYDFESDLVLAKADITNVGSESGTVTAALMIDGTTVAAKTYSVGAGKTVTAEFDYQFDKAGKHTIAIGEEGSKTAVVSKDVTIEGSIQGMPVIPDQSGNGNDAYVHGAPELSTDNEGNTALVLNKGLDVASYFTAARDYIEIPDNGGMEVTDGMTGMVKAKWLNDGTFVAFDHYPLMVKGPSISNGINYLFRMGIRVESPGVPASGVNDGDNGYITYGVGFDIENGEYFWNDDEDYSPTTNKWVTYTSSFDREVGGRSYMNDTQTASIKAPNHNAEYTNWEGSPIWIGMSHMAALLTERGRGGYNVGLSAEVSEARFYTDRLEAAEVAAISDDPALAGASKDEMVVWLDFNNIEEVGTHTTEWVKASDAESLTYTAAISGDAVIKAVVQVSDDQSAVKDSKQFELANGTKTIDLSGLDDADYIRIVTTFTSDLNKTNSSIPVLKEYVLKTEKDEMIWNTAASFAKGTFEGAVAHQSEEFYANYVKEVDDYAGAVTKPSKSQTTAKNPDVTVQGAGGNAWGTFTGDVIITADKGYTIASITVNGKSVTIPADGKLSGLGVKDTVVITFARIASALPFTDIAADHANYEAIQHVYDAGLMVGVGDGTTFAPDMALSRAMVARMVHVLEGEEAAPVSNFTDVLRNFWYTNAIDWASSSGVIAGYGNGTYGPNEDLTREQLAMILYQYLKSENYLVEIKGDLSGYADGTVVGHWAKDAAAWAAGEGILVPNAANELRATAVATRADVAHAFMTMMNVYE
ncbi:MAG: S-layer homology domain-containing protein [Butyricicoccus sp.]|nr:S-layer homology domain-containing protein [Butyricicoccus sp.]